MSLSSNFPFQSTSISLLKPPAFTSSPKTIRCDPPLTTQHIEAPPLDHLTLPHTTPTKLITHNERVGSKTTTFSEKVTLEPKTKDPKTTARTKEIKTKEKQKDTKINETKTKESKTNEKTIEIKTKDTKNETLKTNEMKVNESKSQEAEIKDDKIKEAEPSKGKIQRGYSWKISRPSLRKKSGKSRSGSDSDAILILNNGRDHSQCNGGGVTRHVSYFCFSKTSYEKCFLL